MKEKLKKITIESFLLKKPVSSKQKNASLELE